MTRSHSDRSRHRARAARAEHGLPSSGAGRWPAGRAVASIVLCGIALLADPAASESQFQLPALDGPAGITATTFDKSGHAVGSSSFEIEALAEGLRKMTVKLGIDAGGENVSEVTLATASSGPAGSAGLAYPATGGMRIVEERSQSTRTDGVRLDLLVIDHVAGRASCIPDAGGPEKARSLDLPDRDRVVNVPMQLLFEPLVNGEVEEVRFQIVLCTDGPKLQDMIAVRGPRLEREGREVVEIRYGPDFGKAVAWFASRLLPSFSFWFDAKDGAYLGHRMPLHSKGPEILLVRSGLTPSDLGVE